MLAFGLLMKKGPPRYEKYPLSQNNGMADEEDDRSAVYTPIDDFDDNSRASTMSRMSISMAGSRATSVSSGHEGRQGGGGGGGGSGPEDDDGGNPATPTPHAPPPSQQPAYVRTTKTPPAKVVNGVSNGTLGTGTEGDAALDEARKQQRKVKEQHKERRRQAKADQKDHRKAHHAKSHGEDSDEVAAH